MPSQRRINTLGNVKSFHWKSTSWSSHPASSYALTRTTSLPRKCGYAVYNLRVWNIDVHRSPGHITWIQNVRHRIAAFMTSTYIAPLDMVLSSLQILHIHTTIGFARKTMRYVPVPSGAATTRLCTVGAFTIPFPFINTGLANEFHMLTDCSSAILPSIRTVTVLTIRCFLGSIC